MKHYSKILNFYKKNNCSSIKNISLDSLVDLIYSSHNRKIIFYHDSLYSKIVDSIDINWDDDKCLILAPKNNYSVSAPIGFNQYNQHTIDYFSKIYLGLPDDIRAILCPDSERNIKIKNKRYDTFIINKNTSYSECLNFCQKHYEKKDIVLGVNQYATRGGIIDLYPDISSNPKRVIFLDEKTKIKNFNIESQITKSNKIDELKILIQNKSEIGLDHFLSLDNNPSEIITIFNNNNLVINNNINNKSIEFPFKKINYQEYKANLEKYTKIEYEKTNRSSAFIYKNKIIAPQWFLDGPDLDRNNNIIDMNEINVGDYVVHRDYGIGKFVGLKHVNNSGANQEQELIVVQYQDKSHISIDINHLYNITFYASKNESINIDSLVKQGAWVRRKKTAIKNVQNIVNKLVNTYINRENSYREPIIAVDEEKMFINEFEHIPTKDQIACWEDIKNDLNNNMPLDRLICGDVGFGKTELAIRIAYRYVSNNKKVIVLSPTTILSEQLYKSFKNRLDHHGLITNRISRFRNVKTIKNIKDNWIQNKLDILIGTHALLYNKIYLQSCDLLIIDEEHRFGVKQKEKIKNINPAIDILTMSATPIPRTLNMALSGMKKISTLSTPPKYRKPIITNITYFDEKIITNAINNEIFRNGQVYFVHNNVNTILSIVGFLEKKLPHLSIEYIHGQMNSKKIETKMKNFTNKKINVLVCTSIIENGIDISNVNTIIINNAHNFGLSQLYQIRGRVGRSEKQAYAFLLIPNKIKLTSTAHSRLKAIEEYTNLGSGYKISNMDLTIRGGGSIFGYDQSGNIENVGYELVSKFINEYIHKNINININFIYKGIIPIDYINSEKLRLLIYRKIKSVSSFDELNLLIAELIDRFGIIPVELMQIINIQKIYIICKTIYINLIEEKEKYIIIHFEKSFWEQKISDLLNKINEFVKEQAINYEIKQFKESLVLKIIVENKDSIKLINTFVNILKVNK